MTTTALCAPSAQRTDSKMLKGGECMTTKELYDTIISKPDLHSLPKIYDQSLIWHLYKTAYVRACCDGADSFIEIFGGDGFTGSLMRQRLDENEMVNAL